ncbi:MAG: hypothetical protein V1859_01725 [archaeon]
MTENKNQNINILSLVVSPINLLDSNINKTLIENYKNKKRTCLVCINKTYDEAKIDAANLKIKDLKYIDVLSSHYQKKEDTDDCIFVSAPYNLTELESKISEAAKSCDAFVVDTLCALLKYNRPHEIVLFIDRFSKSAGSNEKVVFASRECSAEESFAEKEMLFKDLLMFTDRLYEL